MREREASPLVSVIIATYNWPSVLRYAIGSVLWQSLEDWELIVVGDGCDDDTADVVASFGDRRISWHNLESNSGSQSAPNNAGVERARGRYVAYLGHDDLWFPDHLGLLHAAAERDGADVAYSIAEMIGPEGSNLRVLTGLTPPDGYRVEVVIPPSALLHRRDLSGTIGGWRDYRELELPPDREFVLRAHAAGASFTAVEELTVLKLNSAWRPNSYRERPSHEQAAYAAQIREDPNRLRYREVLTAARIALLGIPPAGIDVKPAPKDGPLGWEVGQWRRIRGLEPHPGY